MANVKLIFQGTKGSQTSETGLECYLNASNEIFIKIKDYDDSCYHNTQIICLDRDTAIKLHRELKKQISFFEVQEGGGQND
jgi:hypothetical protein